MAEIAGCPAPSTDEGRMLAYIEDENNKKLPSIEVRNNHAVGRLAAAEIQKGDDSSFVREAKKALEGQHLSKDEERIRIANKVMIQSSALFAKVQNKFGSCFPNFNERKEAPKAPIGAVPHIDSAADVELKIKGVKNRVQELSQNALENKIFDQAKISVTFLVANDGTGVVTSVNSVTLINKVTKNGKTEDESTVLDSEFNQFILNDLRTKGDPFQFGAEARGSVPITIIVTLTAEKELVEIPKK